MAKRITAVKGTKTLAVKIFQQENGVQLPMVLATLPGRKAPIPFVMTADVAAHHGRLILEAAERCHQWNTLPVTKRPM